MTMGFSSTITLSGPLGASFPNNTVLGLSFREQDFDFHSYIDIPSLDSHLAQSCPGRAGCR
jgi:hypothetical protein